MSHPSPTILLAYWHRARDAEIGLALRIPGGPKVLRLWQNDLYKARSASGDTDLDAIRLVLPDGAEQIWLIKESVNLEEEDAPVE